MATKQRASAAGEGDGGDDAGDFRRLPARAAEPTGDVTRHAFFRDDRVFTVGTTRGRDLLAEWRVADGAVELARVIPLGKERGRPVGVAGDTVVVVEPPKVLAAGPGQTTLKPRCAMPAVSLGWSKVDPTATRLAIEDTTWDEQGAEVATLACYSLETGAAFPAIACREGAPRSAWAFAGPDRLVAALPGALVLYRVDGGAELARAALDLERVTVAVDDRGVLVADEHGATRRHDVATLALVERGEVPVFRRDDERGGAWVARDGAVVARFRGRPGSAFAVGPGSLVVEWLRADKGEVRFYVPARAGVALPPTG